MRVTIILVDSELERIPEGVHVKPRCDIDTKVLESYLHRDVLAKLPEGSRRGRPDMIHGFLNLCQSSIANKRGYLRMFVHTRNDSILNIGRMALVPQNYLEYLGFMDELLENGKIGSGEEEISISKGTFLELMDRINVDVTVVMSPEGRQTPLRDLLPATGAEEVAIVIGGFPEGEFKSPVYDMADYRVSLGPELLTITAVGSEVLASIPR
jgi:rRNA small subunit pseudouridine methyltransferase Nep1